MILRPFIESAELFTLSGNLKWRGNILEADYCLKGPLQNILHLSGAVGSRSRLQGLWKTTCFEWFLKPIDGDIYYEGNFSPAGDWNVFRLAGYRKDLEEETNVTFVKIQSDSSELEWHLKTEVDFSFLKFPKGTHFQAHLSAVLETIDEKKHFWSLKHSQKQPDFHHPDHFILEIQKES